MPTGIRNKHMRRTHEQAARLRLGSPAPPRQPSSAAAAQATHTPLLGPIGSQKVLANPPLLNLLGVLWFEDRK